MSTCICVVLYLEPLIECVLHLEQSLLPSLDPGLKRLDEGGAPHRLCLDDLVIEVGLDVINGRQD